MRNQLAKLEALLEDAHEERDLQADQRAHQNYHDVQNQAECFGVGEREKQHRGRESADQPNHQLDRDEAGYQAASQESRKITADAHRE